MRLTGVTAVVLVCLAAMMPLREAGAGCSYNKSVSSGAYVFTIDSRPVSGCGIQVLRLAVARKGKVVARLKSDIDMAVENAWADDLDRDGLPELVITGRCAGNEKRATAELYRIEGGALKRVALPGLPEGGGYRGGDRFSRAGSSIVRTLPLYQADDAAGRPRGGFRTVTYGYATGRLEVLSDTAPSVVASKPVQAAVSSAQVKESAPPRLPIPSSASVSAPDVSPASTPVAPSQPSPVVATPPAPAPAATTPVAPPAPSVSDAASAPPASAPVSPAGTAPSPAPVAAAEQMPAFPAVPPGTVSYQTNEKGERVVVVERRTAERAGEPPVTAVEKRVGSVRAGVPQVTAVAVVGRSIELRGASLGTHRLMRLTKPQRIAIDIAKGNSPLSGKTIAINANGITRVRVGKSGATLRLVFDTDRASFPVFSIRTTETGLAVDFPE